MRNPLDFDDAGAEDSEPAKGITVGDVRAWHDEFERLNFKLGPGAKWECAARRQGTAGGNEPADCNWPVCGCDPTANKVIEALEESGALAPPSIER